MQPLPEFSGLDRSFWAHIKLLSEKLGYSSRGKAGSAKNLRRYTLEEITSCLEATGLESGHLRRAVPGRSVLLGELLCRYLNRRADLLEQEVAPMLMNRDQAAVEFKRLCRVAKTRCSLPMNKQKGEKRHPAYLAGIINILTERALAGKSFDDEPRGLTVVTKAGRPLRVLSRWMDGAYPSRVDPHAVWEVKEYYGTTTFGSRVADGVYETMLDGEELAELALRERRKVFHYLIVDDRFTWWECGRSYLCRIIDMLHLGLVDEVLFGREVLERWPAIVRSWP